MASGVNTAAAAHSAGTIGRCERPCARKPGTPKSAAKPMPSARCHPVRASSGSGTAPATGPDGAIRYSALRLNAQRTMTSAARSAAAGTAAMAAVVRQAIAMVARARTVKTMSVAGSCRLASTRSVATMRYAPSDADETSSISSGAASGPEQEAGHDQCRGQREADDDMKEMRAERRDRVVFQSREGPERAEDDRGDRQPPPHADACKRERRGRHDREIDVERPVIRLIARHEQRRHIGADEAEAGERGAVQQRGRQRRECDDAEQDEGDAGIEEIIERVGGVDVRIRDNGARGGQDAGDVGARQARNAGEPLGAACPFAGENKQRARAARRESPAREEQRAHSPAATSTSASRAPKITRTRGPSNPASIE